MSRFIFVALIVVLSLPVFGVAEANPGTPDLQIVDASVTIPDPAQPNMVYVEVSVANRGDAPASAFAIRWYPHQASNEVGCSTNVSGLDAGKKGRSKCNYTYVDDGQMHWRAVVDEEAEVPDSNEGNNTQTGTVTVGGPSASPAAGYDLYVRRMDFSPAPHSASTPIQMWPMIATDAAPEGSPPFPASHFRWRKGPNFPWQQGACAADDHIASCLKQVEFSYDQPGTYVVEVQADNLSEVSETEEGNNTRTWTLNVGGPQQSGSGNQADLLILYPRFEPSPVIQGQPFEAVMVVRNGGNAMATGPFTALWDFPDGLGIEDCAWQIDELAAHSAATLTCERTTNKKGQASTSLTVDAANVVPEPDEANNDVTVPMTMSAGPSGQPEVSGSKPDLLIEEAHFEPSHPVPGQTFEAVMTVRNNSSVAVTQPFRALWEFHEALGVEDCQWEFSDGLGASVRATARCERTTNASPGQSPTTPTVDADNVIAELDEVNNDHPVSLILYATDTPDGQGPSMPDFMVENLHVTPNPATPGQQLTVSFDVVNWGAAAPASEARWTSSDPSQQSINRDVPALATGASHHVELSNVAAPNAPGSYVHTAIAESRCLIDEESETNNQMLGNDAIGTESLVVMEQVSDHPDPSGPPADLVVRNLDITPNPVAPGQDMLVEFEVVNQGGTTAPASVADWHTPPGAGLSFRCNVPALQPGGSSRCSRQFAAPPRKNYGTTARADVDNTVDEGSRENNNTVKVTLRVQ